MDSASKKKYDLIISDIELGSINGFHVVEILNKSNIDAKYILLTGTDLDHYELQGLRLGVDEFLRKNTTFAIMIERIKKVIATESKKNKVIEDFIEKIRIDMQSRQVYKEGALVLLTQLEHDLLVYLIKNKNRVLSRETILQDVWNSDGETIDPRTIDTFIKVLRQKLRIESIYSVRGIGYKWNEKK